MDTFKKAAVSPSSGRSRPQETPPKRRRVEGCPPLVQCDEGVDVCLLATSRPLLPPARRASIADDLGRSLSQWRLAFDAAAAESHGLSSSLREGVRAMMGEFMQARAPPPNVVEEAAMACVATQTHAPPSAAATRPSNALTALAEASVLLQGAAAIWAAQRSG